MHAERIITTTNRGLLYLLLAFSLGHDTFIIQYDDHTLYVRLLIVDEKSGGMMMI